MVGSWSTIKNDVKFMNFWKIVTNSVKHIAINTVNICEAIGLIYEEKGTQRLDTLLLKTSLQIDWKWSKGRKKNRPSLCFKYTLKL